MRRTRNVGILLEKERYWDITDTKDIKLDILETTLLQDKYQGKIQAASKKLNEIQGIKRNVNRRKKQKEKG